MDSVFLTILSLSVSGSVLACILFLLKPIIKDRMSKTWQYYIWLVVLARLILPFSFENNLIKKVVTGADSLLASEYAAFQQSSENLNINRQEFSIESYERHSEATSENGAAMLIPYMRNLVKNHLWPIWLAIATLLLMRKSVYISVNAGA